MLFGQPAKHFDEKDIAVRAPLAPSHARRTCHVGVVTPTSNCRGEKTQLPRMWRPSNISGQPMSLRTSGGSEFMKRWVRISLRIVRILPT